MIIQHIQQHRYTTTNWSGGTTSELFIHPEGATFSEGDYNLRISIATVEQEKSTFTTLPEVDRTLMVLQGKLRLEHEGHHCIELNEFEQDHFKGDWKTTSYGEVTDFNVMMKNGTESAVQKVDLVAGELLTLAVSYSLQFIYIIQGKLRLNETELCTSESVVIQAATHTKLVAETATTLILVSVDLKR